MNTYPGGKNGSGAFQTIINQIPPHECYIEPFVGSGSIMRRKRAAIANIAIDADVSCTLEIKKAVPGVIAITGDARSELLAAIAKSGVTEEKIFIYVDPPYLFSTRASKIPIYDHEFGNEDQHRELLRLLKSLKCMVMISGYWSQLYADELRDWRTLTYNSITRAAKVAEEWLWMNYEEPIALHDFSYIGDNYRERERIKRKINRWQKRIEKMPVLEKRALLLAITSSQR